MSTEQVQNLEKRVSALEIAVGGLMTGRVSNAATGGGSTGAPAQSALLRFDQLENAWANKTVRRDPMFWKGESYAGQTYSECPPAYLDKLAEGLEYSVRKEKAKPEPGKGKNGKFFYENDEFEAKLARTWAAKKRAEAQQAAAEPLPGTDGAPF